MKVILHPDGGVGVGLGHVSRCAALSNALVQAGHQALLLVEPERQLLEHVTRQGVAAINCGASATDVREAAVAFGANCVVIDSYRWTTADFCAVKGDWAVVTFDDEALRKLPVDAVINGAPAATELSYPTASGIRLWLGPPYQIVRNEFTSMPPHAQIGPVKHVIALVGGDDPLGLLPVLAQLLDIAAARSAFAAELICGPFAPMPKSAGLRNVTILRNPADLPERMARADLAISASGQTLYELARCGTPTIAFCSGPDQVHNLRAFANAHVVWNVGDAASPHWARDLSSAIDKLIGDTAYRVAMSQAGPTLIDGLGAERLVSKLESLQFELLSSSSKSGACN
jgi:UDP-2,4-diacetamido-2,4,6-trideoxy-beta-L-altropyranose hydrolase